VSTRLWKLSTKQKRELGRASSLRIGEYTESLKYHLRRGRWLGISNRYRRKTVSFIRRDLGTRTAAAAGRIGAPRSLFNSGQLAQYIAASATLHCADGWSFLGRALDSHTRGDTNIARHLAYYAELRAAISLLACEGVGIFLNEHFIVPRNGDCTTLSDTISRRSSKKRHKSGTHEITWLALEHWADRIRSGRLFERVIAPGNVPLTEWLEQFSGFSGRIVGSRWLKLWGLDLRRMSDDHDARNEASYRPTRLNNPASLGVVATSAYLRQFWAVSAPSSISRFEILDRHLLRRSLENVYKAITGDTPQTNPTGFEARVVRMINSIAPVGLSEDSWRDFLVRRLEPLDAVVITEAAENSPVEDSKHHLQVMSRALLLLRVATGACARHLRTAGGGRVLLEFWWKPLGKERGLWQPGDEPNDFAELWDDIETALADARDWETFTPPEDVSFYRWWHEIGRSIQTLGSCERLALWGLDL
jgi:hypothetical protein